MSVRSCTYEKEGWHQNEEFVLAPCTREIEQVWKRELLGLELKQESSSERLDQKEDPGREESLHQKADRKAGAIA